VRRNYAIAPPADTNAAEQRASVYDGAALRWLETKQQEERDAMLSVYRHRLVDGPVLSLPVAGQFSFSFDPNGVVPLDDTASAYGTLRVTDDWGVLEVSNGALLVRDQNRFSRVVVEAPKATVGTTGDITGNGWKLTLSQGWVLSEGDRPGDLRATKPQGTRIRVGGDVQAPKRINYLEPVYPEAARTAGIEGDVTLRVLIGRDGSVLQIQYVNGPKELAQAAIDAVRSWRYMPTLLNDEPVEVDTTVDVNFKLN